MGDAVWVAKTAGGARFRLAAPGGDAKTDALEDLAFHEGISAIPPLQSGTVAVNGGSSSVVSFSGISPVPLVYYWGIGRTTGDYYGPIGSERVFVYLRKASTTMKFVNNSSEIIDFRYYIFDRYIT